MQEERLKWLWEVREKINHRVDNNKKFLESEWKKSQKEKLKRVLKQPPGIEEWRQEIQEWVKEK